MDHWLEDPSGGEELELGLKWTGWDRNELLVGCRVEEAGSLYQHDLDGRAVLSDKMQATCVIKISSCHITKINAL